MRGQLRLVATTSAPAPRRAAPALAAARVQAPRQQLDMFARVARVAPPVAPPVAARPTIPPAPPPPGPRCECGSTTGVLLYLDTPVVPDALRGHARCWACAQAALEHQDDAQADAIPEKHQGDEP